MEFLLECGIKEVVYLKYLVSQGNAVFEHLSISRRHPLFYHEKLSFFSQMSMDFNSKGCGIFLYREIYSISIVNK